jgi:hypothetical protein
MGPQYDVFLSYTKRRDVAPARIIARSLSDAGYQVWFDEEVFNQKTSWRMTPKEELIPLLRHAVSAARCAVIFAVAQEAIPDIPFGRCWRPPTRRPK